MKIYTACLALLLFIAACKKGDPGNTVNTSLIGKWKVIGNYISSGGPMYFVPATKADYDYTRFTLSSTVEGTAFTGFKNYALKDSTTITLTKDDKTTYQNFYYKIKGDTLKMSPNGPIFCMEGCVIVFVKTKD